MPLLVAVAGLLSVGILSAGIERRAHGIRASRGWAVAESLAVFVLGGIVSTVIWNAITG
jgi:hypothetical protein